jgi:hypothetical protein
MGRGVLWCGKWLPTISIGFSLGQIGIGDKRNLTGPKRGPCLAFLPTSYGRNRLVAWTGETTAKKGDLGPYPPRNVKWPYFIFIPQMAQCYNGPK